MRKYICKKGHIMHSAGIKGKANIFECTVGREFVRASQEVPNGALFCEKCGSPVIVYYKSIPSLEVIMKDFERSGYHFTERERNVFKENFKEV